MLTEMSAVGSLSVSHSSVAPCGLSTAATAALLPGVSGAWPELIILRVKPPSAVSDSTAEMISNDAASSPFGSISGTTPASSAPGTSSLSAFCNSLTASSGSLNSQRKCRMPPLMSLLASMKPRHRNSRLPSSRTDTDG